MKVIKEIHVDRSEIVESDPNINRVRLTDGRTVSAARIRIIADTAVEPVFVGIPYAGTESHLDMPDIVSKPDEFWSDMPA